MNPADLEVIIPAYQEAETLELLLPRLTRTLDGLGCGWLVTIVDTSAPMDATEEVCARHYGVRCLRRGPGNTYGDAIRSGFAAACGQWVLVMDADGSHNPEMIPALWTARDQAGVVIASRYVKGGRTENPPVLIAMSQAVNLVFRGILGLTCRDVSNSFRLYEGRLVKGLDLRCQNFDIVEEILVVLLAGNPGLRILEMPSTFERRKKGRSKRNLWVFVMTYLATLWRLWNRKRSVKGKSYRGKRG